jgi:hypothetical protein
MGRWLAVPTVDAMHYASAWQATGDRQGRADQIDFTVAVGRSLDRFTRNPMLRHSLRLMRGPARAAGLGSLQGFLEQGFDAFRSMRGAEPFLQLVAMREGALCERLFSVDVVTIATVRPLSWTSGDDPLGQLP